MANVVEEEEFVVLSKVRAGHKREFQFALKSQNEIAGLLSRTRVRKVPVTKLNDFPAANKIMKISAGRMRKKMSPPKGMESEDEPESDVVDVMSDDECNRHHIVESQRRENVKVNGSEDESDHVVDDERSSVLKKFPTKLKELLETGLLEGLSVKYIRGCKVILQQKKKTQFIVRLFWYFDV